MFFYAWRRCGWRASYGRNAWRFLTDESQRRMTAWLEVFGFWGVVWRGVALGLPVAIALPLLHPNLFAPIDRLINRLRKE